MLLNPRLSHAVRFGGGWGCPSHHESVRPLVPELGSLPEVVQDAGLVDVVQRRHVRHDLRVRRKRLSEALWAISQRRVHVSGKWSVTISVEKDESRGVPEVGWGGETSQKPKCRAFHVFRTAQSHLNVA